MRVQTLALTHLRFPFRSPETPQVLYLNCGWAVDDGEEADYGIVALDPSETREALEHLDFAGYPRRLTIEQSCNGLLLLREDNSFREDKYLVYNPTTKQSKRLPPVPALLPFGDRNKMRVWWRRLAFDPSQSHSYKVVCIVSSIFHCDDYYVGIYSSEIGSWRVCGDPFTQPFLPYETGVYCNGAIHWASKSEDFSLYFDLNEELVWEMPMPPLDDCHDARRYLGESGGRLYLVDYYEDYTTHLDVYEMEIDRSGWFIRFEADLDTLPGITIPTANGSYIFSKSVLYVARGKKAEDSFMVLHLSDADKVIKYNFLSQSHQEICRMEIEMDVLPPAYEYIESLCLV